MTTEIHRAEDIIRAAWNSPEARQWDPNTARTCRITIRPKAKASGLILPSSLQQQRAPEQPLYFVDFEVEYGSVNGAPAYQITGTVNGNKIVVHQGFMEKRKP